MCPKRSAMTPDTILVSKATPSPSPSTSPIQRAPAPSVCAMKSGSRAWIISDETSMRRLTNPSAQTVRGMADEMFGGNDHVQVIEPLEVTDFHNLIRRSYLVLTDSGGIQEEGPSLGKPVLVVRETTERPEGVEAGTLKLVGTSTENIIRQVSRLLEDEVEYERMSRAENPYGDGHASEKIVRAILRYFRSRENEEIPA